MKREWPVTEIIPSGIPGWDGGAFTIAFVYSNKGNFIVKGYYKEVTNHLLKLIGNGYRFFVNFSLRHTSSYRIKTGHRDIWKIWNEMLPYDNDQNRYGLYLCMRDYRKSPYGLSCYKWVIRKNSSDSERSKIIFSFKRMPNRWLPEFENV